MNRSIINALGLAIFMSAAGIVEAATIDEIQYYNPTTGAPASPYNATTQTVVGRVYVLKGAYNAGTHYVIDDSGNGIAFFNSAAPPLTYGDRVLVTGTVGIYQGEIQLSPAPTVTLLGAEAVPTPVTMTIAQAKSDYENVGKFVSIAGTISTPVVSNQFQMHAGTDTIIVYVDVDTGINTGGVAVGDNYRVIAPLVNFTGGIIRLKPRRQSDLHEMSASTLIHVESDGSGDFPTIQSAINFADDGDTIVVGSGVYYGPGNRDIDFCGKAIVVTSTTGTADCVTIDCQGSVSEPHRGFIFHNEEASTSVLRGITVKGGFADSNRGGGILCDAPNFEEGDGPSPTFINCVVRECVGVGILCDAPVWEEGTGGASPILENCTIRDCVGNGVTIRGWFANPSFTNCRIADNVGYGVSIWLASPSFRRCDIDSNSFSGVEGYRTSGSLIVEDCQTVGNKGSGFTFSTDTGTVTIRRLTSAHNGGVGIGCNSTEFGTYDLDDCRVYGNGDDGLQASGDYVLLQLANCDISENQGDAVEISSDLSFKLDNCRLTGNAGRGVHLGTDWQVSTALSLQDYSTRISACEILANGLGGVQGVCRSWNGITVEGCIIRGNIGPGIELALARSDTLEIQDSTVHENAGIGIDLDAPVIIVSRTLVTANEQSAVVIRNGSGAPIISCTDLWGNGGGDWTPPLDTCLGQDGNISADPMYCGPDITVFDTSPCLPGNHPNGADCGIIGARGMGCSAAPHIASIADVGNDEGRQVRLIWERSFYDAAGSIQPITGYGIYRRQDAWKSRMSSRGAAVLPVDDDHARRDEKLLDWDWLATVPARGDATYQYIAATLCDSTIEAGICWSAYLISAMTADPLIFFDSAPDSGYSVDNTAPMVSADSDDIHDVFRILGSAPNPFNPQTTIKYDVPVDGRVALRVYDIRGALIRTLIDADLPRGSHQATWDGRDASGRGMASGSYFARLEAGGKVETVRMALVR